MKLRGQGKQHSEQIEAYVTVPQSASLYSVVPHASAIISVVKKTLIRAAVCALCGVLAALPFRDLNSSLPVWFALAPVFWIVAHTPGRRAAALCALLFAAV